MAAPLRVALTGGIATGKSACLRRFSAQGVPVIDADIVAREVVEPESPGLRAVVRRFGPGVLQEDGSLDRAALGQIVFADARARHDLEAILHPRVYRAIDEWFGTLADATHGAQLAIADIPLLFETSHEGDFDRIVVAICQPDQQIERLMARDKLSREDALRRIAAQMPLDEKRARADYVIDTSGERAETDRQVDEALARLRLDAERVER